LLFIVSYCRVAVNYYNLLGVKPDASLEQIKNAFFDKSKKMHPDSARSNPGLHGQFVELNEAYRVLSKEVSRREYDLWLQHLFTGGQAFRPTSTQPQRSHSLQTVGVCHNNFMDEKNRVIKQIYNEGKSERV
ncbi:dnaJ homolog subfamily C member 4-like, partial [Salvelinus alpinus]|uniref:dnaJ homolog subfamily C member 4-like n=1 Tax=Salvelinus alpinus TaxID=8036 RepID=UPI0039FC161B